MSRRAALVFAGVTAGVDVLCIIRTAAGRRIQMGGIDLVGLPDLVAIGVDRGQADQGLTAAGRHKTLRAEVWVVAANY
jgi:hypothetical protein